MKTFTNGEGKFCLLLNYGRNSLTAEDIAYIEGDGNYSTIFKTDGDKTLSSFTLRKFNDFLEDHENFFNPRKGLLLNVNRISSIEYHDGKLYAVMISKKRLPLSRRKGKALIDYINEKGLQISIR